MAALGWLQRINDLLRLLAMGLAMGIVGFAVISMAASAITRNITGTGYGWLIELPPMMMPWLVFPLLGPLLRAGVHIRVDVAPAYLGRRGNRYLRMFVSAIAFSATVIFFIAGNDAVELFRQMGQMAELEFSFPIWYMYLAFPVGFAMLASFSAETFLTDFLGIEPVSDPNVGSVE